MSMKGKGGKGGKAKGGGKSCSGGGTIDIKRSKDRVTASINESILTLRQALFNDLGQNKDVSVGIAAPFFKYDRKGVDANIEFKTKLNKEEVTWAFDNIKDSMEEIYDASGYGWDDEDKLAQLTEPEARFLVIRESRPEGTVTSPRCALKERNVYDQEEDGKKGEKQASRGDMKQTTRMKMAQKKGQILGVVHFRFSVQGDFTDEMAGAPSLILWDIVFDVDVRRKGLGKHCLLLLELMARRQNMTALCVPVQLSDRGTEAWMNKGGKGYKPLDIESKEGIGFETEEEGFEIYTKSLLVKQSSPVTTAAAKPEAEISTQVREA